MIAHAVVYLILSALSLIAAHAASSPVARDSRDGAQAALDEEGGNEEAASEEPHHQAK